MRKAVIVLAAALLLAGCGTLVIIPKGAETVIRNVVTQKTGEAATNISCPANVAAKAGHTFTCHFLAGGQKYIARMLIVRVKGHGVYYDVSTALG